MNLEVVKNYYGKVLKSSEDLKTSACCDGGGVPSYLEPLLANVHEEVRAKYYGCGIIVPAALEGTRVLDLGSGSGRDVYMIAQLVGPNGEVVGVDMTDEQLATAEAHSDRHMRRFGFARPNVRFLKGYIERLEELGLEPASFDVIVSNCVINLTSLRCCGAPTICSSRAASSISPMFIATGVFPTACAPIRSSTANVSAARFTGMTSCRRRNAPASSTRGS